MCTRYLAAVDWRTQERPEPGDTPKEHQAACRWWEMEKSAIVEDAWTKQHHPDWDNNIHPRPSKKHHHWSKKRYTSHWQDNTRL